MNLNKYNNSLMLYILFVELNYIRNNSGISQIDF